MDYASFVAKGRIVKVKGRFIDLEINKNREVRLIGNHLEDCKVGDYALASGFLDNDKAYITSITTFKKKVKGEYENYIHDTSGQDKKLSNAGIQERSKDIQEKRVYPIYTRNKKTN